MRIFSLPMGKNIFYYEHQKIVLINERKTEIPEGKMSKLKANSLVARKIHKVASFVGSFP